MTAPLPRQGQGAAVEKDSDQPENPSDQALLSIQHLSVDVAVGRRRRTLVQDVSLTVAHGKAVGLVGESGSGKSMTARTIMRLLPARARTRGSIRIEGRDVLAMPGDELRQLRRTRLAMVHQDPRTAINPVRTILDFLTEGVRGLPPEQRAQLAADALRDVGIDNPERRFDQYPHQLSGGLLQRVMIAAVLMPGPTLVLADEPTTALDVTTQSEVMAILSDLQQSRGLGMVFITHDLDLAAAVTDTLAVMYAGMIVETGPTGGMHQAALHPYTAALMAARPSTTRVTRLRTIPGRPIAAFETGPGCVFATRCAFAQDVCRQRRPVAERVGDHTVACHRAVELRGQLNSAEVSAP